MWQATPELRWIERVERITIHTWIKAHSLERLYRINFLNNFHWLNYRLENTKTKRTLRLNLAGNVWNYLFIIVILFVQLWRYDCDEKIGLKSFELKAKKRQDDYLRLQIKIPSILIVFNFFLSKMFFFRGSTCDVHFNISTVYTMKTLQGGNLSMSEWMVAQQFPRH